MFAGYCVAGTVGHKILNGTRKIEFKKGKPVEVKMSVQVLNVNLVKKFVNLGFLLLYVIVFFFFFNLVASDGLYCYLLHEYRSVCFTTHSRQTW